MKKSILSILLFITALPVLLAQAPTYTWDHRYGGNGYDDFRMLIQTGDQGFFIAGNSASDSAGDKTQPSRGHFDYWVVKTDSTGNKQWDKRFGGTQDDVLQAVCSTPDRGYLLAGFSLSDSSGDKTQHIWGTVGYADYWIVKIDSLGNKLWDKRFGSDQHDGMADMKPTRDGGFIMGGRSEGGISGDKTQPGYGGSDDYWIVKTDSLGNKLWDKTYGGLGFDALTCLMQTADGGYLVAGYSDSDISGDKTQASRGGYDYWVLKLDSLGNKIWDHTYGGTAPDLPAALLEVTDGYFIGGQSSSNSSGDKTTPTRGVDDYWIVHTDYTGAILSDISFGGDQTDELYHISATTDGGFLLVGDSYSDAGFDKTENDYGNEQVWAVKIDSAGIKQWDRTILTRGHDENGAGILINDHCYLFANTTAADTGWYVTQNSRGGGDYWITKFCDNNDQHNGINELSRENIRVYPNPFSSSFIIQCPQINGPVELALINTMGETIYRQKQTAVGTFSQEINVPSLAKGVYFLQVVTPDQNHSYKLVHE